MTDKLPPNLLKLFAPRPPLPYFEPLDRAPAERTGPTISGVAMFMSEFGNHDQDYVGTQTAETRRVEKIRRLKKAAKESRMRQLQEWNSRDQSGEKTRDPYKTLFVSKLSPEIDDGKIRELFEQFGKIVSVYRVKSKISQRPKRYAFVEFDREKDMLDACRESDGLRLGGQRIIVDVERGRTVRDWKPKRLGGGRRSAAPRAPPSFNRGSGGGRGPSDYNRRMRSPMRNRSRSPKRTKYN